MHQYTTGEEAFIRRNWGAVPVSAIAEEFGVTEESVSRHARRMGLRVSAGRAKTRWSEMDDQLMRMLVGRGLSDSQISNVMERGVRAIADRRRKIGA